MNDLLEQFNDSAAENSFSEDDKKKYSLIAMLCYIFSFLFFVPIVIDRNSAYCKFHANQQLALLITEVVAYIFGWLVSMLPVLGVFWAMCVLVVLAALLVLLIVGTYFGKAIRIPFIGSKLNIF